MTPRKGNSLPALTPYSIFWGLSEKFTRRHTMRISTGCRRRCLRELLSKVLAGCAAPDELAWRNVRGIPIRRAWTEEEKLKSGRQDTERETEYTLLSQQRFARYSCLLGHHSWDISCLGQLYPHLSFAAWERSSGWALSVTPSLLKQKPLPLMSLTQSVKPKVTCRETSGWTLSSQGWHYWTFSHLHWASLC